MHPADRFKAALAELVERVMRRVDYFRLTPARVVRQAADGTLEVQPDDGTGLPGMTGVPIRHGLPGVTGVLVAAGTRVRVGFDAGDARRPFAALWDAGQATRITFNGSTRPLAREGDTADGGHLIVAMGLVVSYLPPGTPLPDPLPGGPGAEAIHLTATITGSSMIRA